MSPQLEGLNEVLKRLNKTIADIELHTKEGLTEAALVVKADSVRGTPVDYGNLRSSAFIMITDNPADNQSPSFKGPEAGQAQSDHSKGISEAKGIVNTGKNQYNAIVGYTARYAFWVHEMPMIHAGEPRPARKGNKKRGTFWQGGGNKFLLKSLMKNKSRILQILIKWAKIK